MVEVMGDISTTNQYYMTISHEPSGLCIMVTLYSGKAYNRLEMYECFYTHVSNLCLLGEVQFEKHTDEVRDQYSNKCLEILENYKNEIQESNEPINLIYNDILQGLWSQLNFDKGLLCGW